ncbi:hypothetical protein DWX97_19570 [Bacteroides cellulosilyticus]|uniref:Uncharacterized protein n=2 Tax=Bacteroides cellulosilyticus TaxID=246787 RepID=A0A412IC31_9BACE|nr:hypothetical protein DWX97_19570 [Bacteroides cellulosilyticus]
MSITNKNGVEIFSVQTETEHMKLEFIVLELFARGIEKLLEDKGNISTRMERMLGTLRDVTRHFRHTSDKKGE